MDFWQDVDLLTGAIWMLILLWLTPAFSCPSSGISILDSLLAVPVGFLAGNGLHVASELAK